METVMSKPMPRWYGLSWDAAETAIRVQIRRDVSFPQGALDPANNHRIQRFKQRFGFYRFEFENDLTGIRFGFNRALVVINNPSSEYVEFKGRLPRVRRLSRRKCLACGGEKRERIGGTCITCNGTGRDFDLYLRYSHALSASIDVLLGPLEYNKFETSAGDPQLLTVHLPMWDEGAAIGGMVSSALHRWARQYPPSTRFGDVEEAMKVADARMMGESRALTTGRFRAEIYSDKHHFTLDRFGGGGVWGGPDDDPGDRGYEFYSKDVHTSVDQLTFLAGLAALHDRANREIREQTKTA